MLINQLAKQSGMSRDTIRFYEKIGLINSAGIKILPNRYRNYTLETLEQLLVIKDLKDSGFTLAEIKDMASLYGLDPHSCSDNIPKLKDKIVNMDIKIKALKRMRSKLEQTVSCCEEGCPENCTLNKSLQML